MSNYIYTNEGLVNADELMHYGVPGMRWGRRKNSYTKRAVRGHAGPGRYMTTKRQLAGDKRDLEALNKGQHLSVGLTKKRQAAYDAKDRDRLEKRIASNEKRIADRDHNRQLRVEKKELKTLTKALQKNRFGVNQNKVLSDRNEELGKSKTYAKKWEAAFKNGRGSKEYEAFEREFKRITAKYEDKFVDAWLKDNKVKSASEKGRNYVKTQLFYGS